MPMHDSAGSGAHSCQSPLTYWATRAGALVLAGLLAGTLTLSAQPAEEPAPLRPGEAFVTRFSGIIEDGAGKGGIIDPEGAVGSIIDLRSPQEPPQGQHWIDEPQRAAVRAREVGQVFGVALDNANPPNIYLTATSAFGLHLAPDRRGWMDGMWGQGGGPGTIYRLDARNGYRPEIFAEVRLDGRPNTGPALGNITFDAAHDQLLVSDLETGMIHRIRASDGTDLGYFDHGTEARPAFLDVPSGNRLSLPPIPFDPAGRARIDDCPAGPFERHTECWNFAPSGRRVWGVGVWRHPETGDVRLYYSVWNGPESGDRDWINLPDDEKRNSIWSVRLGPNGEFDRSDVRRELLLPDFFVDEKDIERAGYSHPVSDITFSNCGERPVMLVAERGGVRNLGLGAEYAFAYPHEARALRYELDRAGAWRAVGRYDVGFYDRREEGQPYIRANCSGGIAFGPGYDNETWVADPSRTDEFVWISGDALCSPKGPCILPGYEGVAEEDQEDAVQPAAQQVPEEAVPDDSEVHGIQGIAETAFEEIAPAAAFSQHPGDTDAYPPAGPAQSFLIDTDIDVDAAGGLIEEELVRNDATRIGDIAVYQPCPAPPRAIQSSYLLPVPVPSAEPPYFADHPRDISHARIASHGSYSSHNRFGSHSLYWSHSRFGSHSTSWSHNRYGSHSRIWSHNRHGSHSRRESHNRLRSHNTVQSHFRLHSHSTKVSHNRVGSHSVLLSHNRSGSHNALVSHTRLRSHNISLSHGRVRSHTSALSHSLKGSHNLALSHSKQKSHSSIISKGPVHVLAKSKAHGTVLSKVKQPIPKEPRPKIPPVLKPPVVKPDPKPPKDLPKPPVVKDRPKIDLPVDPKVPPKVKPKLDPLPKPKPGPLPKPKTLPDLKIPPKVTPPKAEPKPKAPIKVEPKIKTLPKFEPSTPKVKVTPPPKVKPTPAPITAPKVKATPPPKVILKAPPPKQSPSQPSKKVVPQQLEKLQKKPSRRSVTPKIQRPSKPRSSEPRRNRERRK